MHGYFEGQWNCDKLFGNKQGKTIKILYAKVVTIWMRIWV